MSPAVERAVAKVAYNPMLTAALRIVQFITPLVLSVVLWVGGNYLAGQAAAMASVLVRVTATEQFDGAADRRITVLENSASWMLASQNKSEAALEKIASQSEQTLAAIAAIQARMDEADRQAARR